MTDLTTPSASDSVTVPGTVPGTDSVNVSVNGEHRTVDSGCALDTLVATLTAAHRGIAAAVNETVVPRGQWSATVLSEGDRVEVLTAVQGG